MESAAAGMVVGEGLLPFLEKLTRKILNLEFVEMRDLMLETWLKEEDGRNVLALPKRRNPPVTDILQWLQCFSGMVGVLSKKYASMIPELMGYKALVIKCSHDFEAIELTAASQHRPRICGGQDSTPPYTAYVSRARQGGTWLVATA